MVLLLQGIRPKTLWVTFCPVLLGSMFAFRTGALHLPSAFAALFSGLLIQIGTNLANDYYDFKKGADTDERVGPTRLTQAGLVSPGRMKNGFMVAFFLASVVGSYLIFRGGWPILVIGILAVLSGILYTAGPFALGYIGAADLFVLVFFGPVAVAGTYYVQTLQVSLVPIIAGFGPGLLAVAILTVNNIRDIKTDAKAGKKTLAVRFGKAFAIREYRMCLAAATTIPLFFILNDHTHYGLMTTLLILPFSVTSIKKLRTQEGPVLNAVLTKTGQLLLLYTVLFALGW